MCLEDKRLGRKSYASGRQVLTGVNLPALLVPANENRVHLSIHWLTGTGSILPEPRDPDVGIGFTLSNIIGTKEFDIETHGQIVTGEWRAFGNAVPLGLYVIETFLAEK